MSLVATGFVQSTGGNGVEGCISRVFATAEAVARAGQLGSLAVAADVRGFRQRYEQVEFGG